MSTNTQIPPPELTFQQELTWLQHYDRGPRPPGWNLTPRAVVIFITGSNAQKLKLPASTKTQKNPKDLPPQLEITEKFVGPRELIERCVVTLASERGLLLVGEPGTAKSMLSELLAAAISGTTALTIQGTAGTNEDHLRYGWNYAMLMAKGPHPDALVPSPILTGMRHGKLVRIEEITRCLPEVQDALISLLSERRIAIPELADQDESAQLEFAQIGFNIIATANLRDHGVSEMSAALKRRFNFEVIHPIADPEREKQLVRSRATASLARVGQPFELDEFILDALVTTFRDLRNGHTQEGWTVEKPTTVMSTAECVSVATSIGLQSTYFPTQSDPIHAMPGYLLGVVLKDDATDRGRLLAYWDTTIKRRAQNSTNIPGTRLWKHLHELRHILEEKNGTII